MPTMWFIRDGRVPYTESGPGTAISFEEAAAVFGTEELHYIGPSPPSIRPDAPSESAENVVLQLGDGEGSTLLLPQAGFYWAPTVRPQYAEQRLQKERQRG